MNLNLNDPNTLFIIAACLILAFAAYNFLSRRRPRGPLPAAALAAPLRPAPEPPLAASRPVVDLMRPQPPTVIYDPLAAHEYDVDMIARSMAKRRHEDLALRLAIRNRIETTDSLTGMARDLGITFDPSPAPPPPKP